MKLELKTFSYDKMREYTDAVKAELIAGSGPDIVLIDPYNFSELSQNIWRKGSLPTLTH